MKTEVDTSHGKITVDDTLVVSHSEHYDIYQGTARMLDSTRKHDNVIKLYAVHNEFGPLALVFARSAEDALDDAADTGKLDGYRVSDDSVRPDDTTIDGAQVTFLGNAGDPFALGDYVNIVHVPMPAFSLAALFASDANFLHRLDDTELSVMSSALALYAARMAGTRASEDLATATDDNALRYRTANKLFADTSNRRI